MPFEYWYVGLPSGAKARGETEYDAINRELSELVGRGWEPVTMTSPHPSLKIYVMFRKSS